MSREADYNSRSTFFFSIIYVNKISSLLAESTEPSYSPACIPAISTGTMARILPPYSESALLYDDVEGDTRDQFLPPLSHSEDNWCLFPSSPSKSNAMFRKPVSETVPMPSDDQVTSQPWISHDIKWDGVTRVAPRRQQRRVSVASESYPPELTDDQVGSSDSDASIDDDHYQATMAQLYDTYYTPPSPRRSPQRRRQRLPIFAPQDHRPVLHHTKSANFDTMYTLSASEFQDSSPLPTIDLYRSAAKRTSRQASPPDVLKTLPLPPPPPNPNRPFNTWPLRYPPPPTPPSLSLYPTQAPRRQLSIPNLRPSTAPTQQSRLSPTSPCFPPVEKSVFEDDDESRASKMQEKLAAKFHIRSISLGTAAKKAARPVSDDGQPKRRSMRRSASDVIKGIFGLTAR